MSSQVRGVQGLISQKNPKALSVHCNSHVLNLVIVKACSLPKIRNMAGTITEIANFFNYSPNRQMCLETAIGCNQPDSRGRSVTSVVHIGLSATRHTKHLPYYCHQWLKHLRLFWMSSSTNSIVWKCPGTGKERLFRRQVAAITHVARFSFSFR